MKPRIFIRKYLKVILDMLMNILGFILSKTVGLITHSLGKDKIVLPLN